MQAEQETIKESNSADNTKKWYVIRAISGKEKKIKHYIETEVNRLKMSQFVSQLLIPTEKVYQIRNGKKISKDYSLGTAISNFGVGESVSVKIRRGEREIALTIILAKRPATEE